MCSRHPLQCCLGKQGRSCWDSTAARRARLHDRSRPHVPPLIPLLLHAARPCGQVACQQRSEWALLGTPRDEGAVELSMHGTTAHAAGPTLGLLMLGTSVLLSL